MDGRVHPPFHDAFRGVGAGLVDGAGLSTGLSVVLATAAGAGHVPANLALHPADGELAITTSAGIAQGTLDTQENALGVGIGLPNGVFRVEATLMSPPAGSGAYEQAGIWFGTSQQNFIKLALISQPDAVVIQGLLEENDVYRTPPLYGRVAALPDRLRLSLEIDPARREARAYATQGTSPEQLIGTFADVPESWLGLAPGSPPEAVPSDDASNATPPAFAGIYATHRSRDAADGALTYRFRDFDVSSKMALPDEADALGTEWTVVPALPGVTFNNATNVVEAPGTGHLFVTEREGRVYAVPRAGGPKHLALDLSAVTQGYQDCGLIGLVFHPQFGDRASPSAGYVYLHYAFADPPMPPPVVLETATESRLSRFTVDLDTLTIDPSTEVVLIAQQDQHVWHQGGAMFFGPEDGFLYLTVGDEGGSLCVYDNCQRIDRDLFGGVLRIDVDQRGGAVSHPIARQPESGVTGNYFIPNDNPFVGPGALEEFYAIGLRSPHRMTHDPVDGSTWIGDVGQNHIEELDVLRRAGNYQWNYLEGSFERLALTEEPLGIWTDPVLELPRDESNAVIGGVVYRGSAFPELYGKYIFGDHVYGSIWALEYDYDGTSARALGRERLLTGMLGRSGTITSFGVDADNELYVLSMGPTSPLYRLQRVDPTATVPSLLSQVGAFENLATLEPSSGLIGYEVQVPLFSDGAVKRRWMKLPERSTIGFAENGAYRFPDGTVFVKHFDLALDQRQPERLQRLETRFLVAASGRYYGISYRWNADGTDAAPVFDSQLQELDVTLADGSVRHQRYYYPSPSDCLVCHNADAGYVLGVRTAQLNRDVESAATGASRPQLLDWSERGLFDTPLDAATLETLPRLAPLGDEGRSLEDRVRSYLDGNCSMCHGVIDGLRARWDARYQTPLGSQNIIDGALSGEADLPAGSRVVAPGDPSHSALWLRDGSVDRTLAMPPLGRQQADEQYLEVLERWILSLTPIADAP
jgi:glucose/arabinose dehydrogenase